MHVVDFLLHPGIVGERTVVNSLDPIISAKTGRHVDCVGKSVVKFTRSIVGHQAEAVKGTVGQHAEPPSRTDGGRIGQDVGHSVVTADTTVGRLIADGGFLAPGCLVQSAPEGIRRIAGHRLVHLYSTQIDILGLIVVTPVLEADGTEAIACHIVVGVIRAEENGRIVSVAGIVHVKLDET